MDLVSMLTYSPIAYLLLQEPFCTELMLTHDYVSAYSSI